MATVCPQCKRNTPDDRPTCFYCGASVAAESEDAGQDDEKGAADAGKGGAGGKDWASVADQGTAHYNAGRYDEALKCFEEALAMHQRQPSVWYNKGNTLLMLEKPPNEAFECYKKAVTFNARHTGSWNNGALTLERLNRWKDALMHWEEVLRMEPEREELQGRRARCLLEMDKAAEAKTICDETLQKSPKVAQVWAAKSLIAEKLGNPEVAKQAAERAAELGYEGGFPSPGKKASSDRDFRAAPDSAAGAILADLEKEGRSWGADEWLKKGEEMLNEERYEVVIGCMDKVLSTETGHVAALVWKGVACLSLGKSAHELKKRGVGDADPKPRLEEALKCFEEALEKDPNNRDVPGRVDEARELLGRPREKAREKPPETPKEPAPAPAAEETLDLSQASPDEPAEEEKPPEKPPPKKPQAPLEAESRDTSQPQTPLWGGAQPAQMPAEPAPQSPAQTQPPAQPVQEPAQPQQPPIQPVQEPAQLQQPPAQPVQPVQPQQPPVQPVQEPAQPQQPPVQPVQEPAQPQQPPAQPAPAAAAPAGDPGAQAAALAAQAKALMDAGKHAEALPLCAQAIKLRPELAEAWAYKGLILGAMQCLDESLAAFKKATELAPGEPMPWAGCALAHLNMGNLEEAQVAAEHALRIDPNHQLACSVRDEVVKKIWE